MSKNKSNQPMDLGIAPAKKNNTKEQLVVEKDVEFKFWSARVPESLFDELKTFGFTTKLSNREFLEQALVLMHKNYSNK